MSPSNTKRRRAAERARHEAYLQRRAQKEHRRRRVQQVIAGVLVAGLVGLSAWWLVVARSGHDSASPTPTSTPTPSPTTPQWAKPEQVLVPNKPATATMDTNHGSIVIDLDTKAAPKASNSMAFLASQGYFDASTCHRLTADPKAPLFVLQCGDPTGTGSGGPGYTLPDENLPKSGTDNYPAGTVAMAEDSSGRAGSQFFLVYEDTTLDPNYTIVGHVASGMDVLHAIAAAGVRGGGTDGPPKKPVVVKTLTVDQG